MTESKGNIHNEDQPGSVPQEELKRRDSSGEDILSGANQTDQLERLHPDEKKNREEVGSPPVEHVSDGSAEDALREESEDEDDKPLNAS